MEKETMLKIVSAALDIGVSNKHYVSVDTTSNSGAFPVIVYIHIRENGYSAGVCDAVHFSMDESYELHEEWFRKWALIVAKEREADDTP